MTLPDFLVIGAQKAGTTWLYENLRQHPQVWLPPIKELHYFDRGSRPLILDAVRGRQQRDMLWRWLKPALTDARQHPDRLGWYRRFFLARRSDSWYTRLFQPPTGMISGDITPAYARLSASGVERVAALLPHARVIYLLRNPIERMWSQAAMYFSRYGNRGLEHAAAAQIDRFLGWELARANNDYLAVIERWSAFYAPSQFHVDFFDRILEAPAALYADVCAFLEIEPSFLPVTLDQRVHHRDYAPMPAPIRERLTAEYRPLLEALHARFDNAYTARWLAQG